MPDVESTPLRVPADFDVYGRQMLQIADNIETHLMDLNRKLSALEGVWQDDAKIAYSEVQADWHVAAASFMTAEGTLGEIAALHRVNWNNYVDMEVGAVKNARGY